MANKIQELNRPGAINTNVQNIQQTAAAPKPAALKLSEDLQSLISLAPKAQGLFTQLEVRKEQKEKKLSQEVDDILEQGVTEEELSSIVNPVIRSRVQGNQASVVQSEEFLKRLNSGEFDDKPRNYLESEWNNAKTLNMEGKGTAFEKGFNDAANVAFSKLNSQYVNQKINFNIKESETTRTSNMFNWTTSVSDLSSEEIFNKFEKDKEYQNTGDVKINYNHQQSNSAFLEAVKGMVANGQDVTKFIEVAETKREDGNSMFSANPTDWASIKVANKKTTDGVDLNAAKEKAERVRQLENKQELNVSDQKGVDELLTNGDITESKFITLTKKNTDIDEFNQAVELNSASVVDGLIAQDQDSVDAANSQINALKNVPGGEKVAYATSENIVMKVLGQDAMAKIETGDLTNNEWDVLRDQNANTGFVFESWKNIAESDGPNSPQYDKLLNLYSQAKNAKALGVVPISKDMKHWIEMDMAMVRNNISEEDRLKAYNRHIDPEVKNLYVGAGKINEFRKLAEEQYAEADLVGQIDDIFVDHDIFDSVAVRNEVVNTAQAMSYIYPDLGTNAVFKLARSLTDDNVALVDSNIDRGGFSIFAFANKKNAVMVEPQYDAKKIGKSMDEFTKGIWKQHKKELEKAGVVEGVHLVMDDNFNVNGLYHVVDHENQNISKYNLSGFSSSTVNGDFFNNLLGNESIVEQGLISEKALSKKTKRDDLFDTEVQKRVNSITSLTDQKDTPELRDKILKQIESEFPGTAGQIRLMDKIRKENR